ncbi:MAG: hypothetical protein ACTHJT_08265 [Cytophaga sp.]|uniref:hypothetical protein n=1 Tax=Cytophaga sp. TaxID=29535 RepID=UPI003F8109BD
MNKYIYIPIIIIIALMFTSCSVVGGIFKAGMGVGVFISILLVGGIIYFVARFSNNE